MKLQIFTIYYNIKALRQFVTEIQKRQKIAYQNEIFIRAILSNLVMQFTGQFATE